MNIKMDQKGRILIPFLVRKRLNINPDCELSLSVENDRIILVNSKLDDAKEKAIEYIESKIWDDYGEDYIYFNNEEIDQLLEILKRI